MHVLVTGAAGFVGRHLCAGLLDQGHVVSAAVRRSISQPELSGARQVVIGDIGSDTDWRTALEGVDTIIHAAARAHVMRETDPNPGALFHRVNVDGARRLARAAAAAGVGRFVFISSVKAAGENSPASRPLRVEDTPQPEDIYGRTKHAAEALLRKTGDETGLDVVILRPPLIYGPGVKGNMLTLFNVVSRGIPLPLASVRNKRDLIYVGNLIDAISRAMSSPDAPGHTFFVCDGEPVSIGALLTRIGDALGRPARLFPAPTGLLFLAGRLSGRADAVRRVVGSLRIDGSKFRDTLDWTPPFSMEQGLALTAAWYKSRNEE